MGKKYKIGLIIILVFLIVGVGAIYLIKRNKNQVSSTNSSDCEDQNATTCKVELPAATTATTTQTQIGSFGTPESVVENIYKNDTLKFELTFSSVWKGAKITETIPAGAADGKVEFQLSTSDEAYPGGLATPLTIYVYKSENVPTGTDSPVLNKITTNGNLVYGYVSWPSTPSDLGQFTEKEIGQIISTLKIIN